MPTPSPSTCSRSRAEEAAARLAVALGFSPEVAAVEWLEACADAAAADPSVARALADAYRARDTIGWSRVRT